MDAGELSCHFFQADYLDTHYLSDEEVGSNRKLQLWIKSKETLPDDPDAHNSILAYISDMGLLHAGLKPHGLHNATPPQQRDKLIMASLDHAIWFHRPFRADEWFFVECTVQSNGGGRAFSRGNLYTQDGVLFASTSQEGLFRVRKAEK